MFEKYRKVSIGLNYEIISAYNDDYESDSEDSIEESYNDSELYLRITRISQSISLGSDNTSISDLSHDDNIKSPYITIETEINAPQHSECMINDSIIRKSDTITPRLWITILFLSLCEAIVKFFKPRLQIEHSMFNTSKKCDDARISISNTPSLSCQ